MIRRVVAGLAVWTSFALLGSGAYAQQGIANELFEALNRQRATESIGVLQRVDSLDRAAFAHARAMAARDFFSHESPVEGMRTMEDRLRSVDYRFSAAAENIAMRTLRRGEGARPVAEAILAQLTASAGHRRNMMNSTFTETGVGVAVRGSRVYAVQLFGAPRR